MAQLPTYSSVGGKVGGFRTQSGGFDRLSNDEIPNISYFCIAPWGSASLAEGYPLHAPRVGMYILGSAEVLVVPSEHLSGSNRWAGGTSSVGYDEQRHYNAARAKYRDPPDHKEKQPFDPYSG